MLIKSDFEVPQPVDEVWGFFQDIPGVAACLPGAEIDQQVGPDQYSGTVAVRMGPVKMQFAGQAHVTERDEANRTIVVDAAGADERGRGQAAMGVTARLVPTATGTRVEVEQDLQLSGAAAQYGRGMIADVTAVLMRDFSANMEARLDALGRGRLRRPDRGVEAGQWPGHRDPGRTDGAQTGGRPVLPPVPARPKLRRTACSGG